MLKKSSYMVFNLFVTLMLVFGFLPSRSLTPKHGPKIQPELANLAVQAPNTVVTVIVQKTKGDSRVEQDIAQLGGRVTRDLNIIDAVAAEMTATDAVRLGSYSSVRWISVDAKMMSTACSNCVDTTNLTNAYI